MKEYGYDVVIVGLGPAGSSLAYLLSRNVIGKADVAGIDMVGMDGLWGKPCGDAIGKHHFEETGLPEPEGEQVRQRVDGIYIISPSEKHWFKVRGEGYVIDRNKYGRRLVEEARKRGVDIYLGYRIVKPVVENGKLTGVEGVDVSTRERVFFRAKIVVDATGYNGVLRRRLPKEWPVNEPLKPTDANIAYREILELDYMVDEPEYLRIYINQDISPGGYWWLFPEGVDRANIGLGVQGGRGYDPPNKIYREKLAKRPELKHRKVLNAAGSLVPTRRPANTLVWHNFIGIGDNAYTVNPIHGGGMGYAMFAALQAAKAIDNALDKDSFTANDLWDANIGYMRTLGAKQASLDIFRMFLQVTSNDDIELGLSKGLMRETEMYETSVTGELKIDMGKLQMLKTLIGMLSRPSLLLKLSTVRTYMNRIKGLYQQYPERPDDLPRWVGKIEKLYNEYKSSIGYHD